MAYFHVTAVFETRGESQEDANRAAVSVFKSVRHPRVYFYEHDINGGIGPFPPGRSLYFTTIAEFDIEASTEEQAGEIADGVLDAVSTDAVQYLGLGVVPGSLRVSPEQRRAREEERKTEPEGQAELEEGDEGEESGRRSRGRRRKRGTEREPRSREDQQPRDKSPENSPIVTIPLSEDEGSATVAPGAVAPAVRPPREKELQVAPIAEPAAEATPLPPPPRSSASMRVTLTVQIRASELERSGEESQEALIALACEEARRRHPELPADMSPESLMSPLPAGDTLLLLTWHFDRPVPSASEAA